MTARALPNRRLVDAFGINNCFSTTDKGYCREFHNRAEDMISLDDSKWMELAQNAAKLAKRELNTDRASLELTPLTQFVAMKLALEVLLGIPASQTANDSAVRTLAAEINVQWVRSKGSYDPTVKPEWQFEDQTNLRAALSTLFPRFDINDSLSNPMNLILPGYETLWRVVIRCFLELVARDHSDSAAWQQVAQRFATDPTATQLDFKGIDGTEVSAAFIAQEALRLYPPTRRVNRQYQDQEGTTYDVSADIETCHRDTATWGQDAMEFNPTRWSLFREAGNLDQVLKSCFMPFGNKPFMCPAKRKKEGRLPFGVAMIAMLVGKLTTEVDGVWKVDGELPKDGVPLNSNREAYHDLLLVRI